MYESTVNIDILKTTGLNPISFFHDLHKVTTVTGAVSGTVMISSVWVNNTMDDRAISVVEISAETQELIEAWVSLIQEKVELEGFTIYISINEV